MIRRIQILAIFILLAGTSVFAQRSVTFSSSDLQEMSQRYAGNILNWPMVVSLADHDISKNEFTLSPEDILKLQNLSSISLDVENQQKRVNTLIENGATIFAPERLSETNQLLTEFLNAIKHGEYGASVQAGSSVKESVDKLETELNENRLVNVQAQLSAKDGEVDKRIGLLASWAEAFLGDLFEESDGLRTKEESFATLSFTDGSDIVVNPNTTAVIRKSRIDKLDESADTEITLVEGGLLSKLSAIGKERSTYILNAGSSSTELNTQNFYAENTGNNNVKLSNYDGDAEVSANNVVVTIKKNEGTIIRNNAAPLPPVKLLDAPELFASKKDTIIYQEDFVFAFRSVPKAERYSVQYSTSFDFNTDVTEVSTTSTRLEVSDLPLGITYIKVQSIDNLGLKGPFSEIMRVIRNKDTKAPPIFGDQFDKSIYFVESNRVIITGVTEPDAIVKVNEQTVAVNAAGVFSVPYTLSTNDEVVTVTSTDNSQNKTVKEVRIAQLLESYLFRVIVNGVEISNSISSSSSLKTITGTAYPEMEVQLTNGSTTRTVKTDSSGRWGATMNVQEGKLSITFKVNQKSTATLTKTYSVQ